MNIDEWQQKYILCIIIEELKEKIKFCSLVWDDEFRYVMVVRKGNQHALLYKLPCNGEPSFRSVDLGYVY